MHKLSPLAPTSLASIKAVSGVEFATAECGIKYKNRTDLLIARFKNPATVAGVFTTSLTASAPVELCRENIKNGIAKLLIVNSGNSNAFTGKKGWESIDRICAKAREVFNCERDEIFISSTGVIGEPLPDNLIIAKFSDLSVSLNESNISKSAEAIMTTDTFAKYTSRTATIGDKQVVISGIAKGSGMIAPDMATMLAYIFTDATIPQNVLQELLTQANVDSFNAITVDGDTSTSDTVLCFATGFVNNQAVNSVGDSHFQDFVSNFKSLMLELAHLVVKDGEGASKFVTINVSGAEDKKQARIIAMSVANSPLVKTAIAGEDANWGRVVMAVGKSGAKADRDRLVIKFGDMIVAENGERSPRYDENKASEYMKYQDIEISVDVGVGSCSYTAYTCDFTEGYIHINGSYRS